MTETVVEALTDEQRFVLETIYERFRDRGDWPTFAEIDRPLRRALGIDAGAVLNTLPQSLVHPAGAGKGTPPPNAQIRLTLLGISRCPLGDVDVDRFVKLLPHLARLEASHMPSSGNELPKATAADAAKILDIDTANQVGLGRMYSILITGSWGIAGAGRRTGNDWEVYLGREIWRYRNVESLDDVLAIERGPIEKALKGMNETIRRLSATLTGTGSETSGTEAVEELPMVPTAYVDEKTIEALLSKSGNGKFDVTKLLALIDELNDNYANENTYSCLALIRAILDHVPPIFGYKSFAEVASSYGSVTWTRTDKDHAKALRDSRGLGDDALHRMITKHVDALSMGDVPAPTRLRVLLREATEAL